jgi:dipeptidyl aminopeptidase/acylaminoacyl peptidase
MADGGPRRTRSAPVLAALAVVVVIAGLAGCTAPTDHPALKDAQLPPLVQAHRFAYRPDTQRGHQLSPDGRKLAWIGPSYLRSALFVRHNDTGKVHRYPVLTGAFQWTPDGRRLLSTSTDTSGAENTHIVMLDTDDPAATAVDLTPYPGVKASIHQILAADPAQLLVYHNRRDRKLFDLYRIDLNTRKETLVAQNPGDGVAPLTSRSGSFTGWQKSRDAQRPVEERSLPRQTRAPELLKNPDETFRVLGSNADGTVLWALSNRGRDRVALVAAHRKLQWEKVLHEDPRVDVTRVAMSRVTGEPLVAYTQPGLPQATILNTKLREDLDGLLKAQGGDPFALDIVSTDAAEKRMIIAIASSTAQRYYLLDRTLRKYTLLSENADDSAPSATVQPITITSRDGLSLHGYLTLPRGVAAKRLPMVLLVHGGPWLRTGSPYRSQDADNARFLANRGYAVLQVDFRGSTGYGKQFLNAAIGEFAGKMHEDLLDAVRWAVDSGIADPARVAIMGWSYGGYAALVGMTLTPKQFACGISLAGPTDLATLIEAFPPYWASDLSMWKDYVGNPAIAQDREEMTRKSPLTHADKTLGPLLIVHGAKDVRVRIDQSERMVEALKRAGKPVEFLAIPDMGHGADWWVHRLVFLRKTEDFLQRCLGGRASRFDPFEPIAWGWQRISK